MVIFLGFHSVSPITHVFPVGVSLQRVLGKVVFPHPFVNVNPQPVQLLQIPKVVPYTIFSRIFCPNPNILASDVLFMYFSSFARKRMCFGKAELRQYGRTSKEHIRGTTPNYSRLSL